MNASSELISKVDQLDTDTHTFLKEVESGQQGIDTTLASNESNLKAIDDSYANITGNTVQAQLAAERTEAFAEATTLSQAMHLAVAPRPDLWLPLVSNLKMREGFGDVSFTRSTTATYINKAGQLVTAQANEPRFEREGILIEGSSTNLLIKSNIGFSDSRPSDTLLPDGVSKAFFKDNVQGAEGERGSVYQEVSVKAGETMTASVWVLIDKGKTIAVSLSRGRGDIYEGSGIDIVGEGSWQRVEVSHTFKQSWDTIKITIGNKDAVTADSFYHGFFQLEKLPFATSYIPTDGSPVTRDADTLSFPFYQNMPDAPASCTIAMDFDWQAVLNDPSIPFYATANKGGYYHIYNKSSVDYSEIRWNGTYNHAKTGLFNTGTNRYVWGFDQGNVFDHVNGVFNRRNPYTPDSLEGKKYTEVYLGLRSFCGHFRNFRIWHTALTPEQIAFL